MIAPYLFNRIGIGVHMRSLSLHDVIGQLPTATVVIAQNDPCTAEGLAKDLHSHFVVVIVAENALELRTLLLRHPKVRVAVLDLEVVNLEEVRQLVRNFDDLAIVCTHRSPDDRMWTAALAAGAVEYCHPNDIRSIVRARRAA
jgi:DNA-binding NarL/FixJ family response regulator